jgi:hypothetical protein
MHQTRRRCAVFQVCKICACWRVFQRYPHMENLPFLSSRPPSTAKQAFPRNRRSFLLSANTYRICAYLHRVCFIVRISYSNGYAILAYLPGTGQGDCRTWREAPIDAAMAMPSIAMRTWGHTRRQEQPDPRRARHFAISRAHKPRPIATCSSCTT